MQQTNHYHFIVLSVKGDLNELFRVHLEKAVNTLLKTELTAFLDYEKYDRIGFNTGNSRNGSMTVRSRPSTGTSSPDSARPQRRVQATDCSCL